MDQALDGLGFSYIDGVPFQVDPRLEAVTNYDLSRVDQLLATPLPSGQLSGKCNELVANIGRMERQFLKQLADLDAEKKAKAEREAKEAEELENRRKEQIAQAEAAVKEAARKKELEESEAEKSDTESPKNDAAEDQDSIGDCREASSPDTETEASTASISDPPKLVSSDNIQKPAAAPVNINFSEFEAESDPFERAELETLNDLQELAAVWQTTATSSFPTPTCSSSIANTSSANAGNVVGYPPTGYPYYHMQQCQPIPAPYFPNLQQPFLPPQQQPPAQVQHHHHHHEQQQQHQQQHYQQQQQQTEMKSSKSVGDIMTEIKREAEAMEQHRICEEKRKNSQTPPPRPSRLPAAHQSKKVLDDWIPWPDLDSSLGPEVPSRPTVIRGASPLADLAPASQEICRQISEMGFPLDRVASGCKSLGDDRQKLINFCLLVDKLANDSVERFSASEVEYVVPIHNLDEDASKKHLRAFQKLQELGFERVSIHNALISVRMDHDKALEKLLK
jgi:hypothetical protein